MIKNVVMPRMNGRQLCEWLNNLWPDMKCQYMSGYTADVIDDHGILKEGLAFIQKPFTLNEFA